MNNRIITIIIFCLSISVSNAQGNSKALEEKNGFKDFRFGQQYGQYSNLLELESKPFLSTDRTYYKYIGKEPSALFYLDWDKLTLGFTGNTLTQISVYYDKLTEKSLNEIISKLENQFGSSKKTDNGLMGKTYSWNSGFHQMTLSYDDINGTPTDIWLSMEDYKLHLKSNDSDKGKF